jgi:catechol 2,3-dioxygenase-like lactoylglutathione lyase family enzyme
MAMAFTGHRMIIHHVQIACPPGSEAALRAFYHGVLGMAEKPKPPALAVRGGCWFTLDDLAARLAQAGHPVRWAATDEIPGVRRFHTDDPNGNRLEFLAPE